MGTQILLEEKIFSSPTRWITTQENLNGYLTKKHRESQYLKYEIKHFLQVDLSTQTYIRYTSCSLLFLFHSLVASFLFSLGSFCLSISHSIFPL